MFCTLACSSREMQPFSFQTGQEVTFCQGVSGWGFLKYNYHRDEINSFYTTTTLPLKIISTTRNGLSFLLPSLPFHLGVATPVKRADSSMVLRSLWEFSRTTLSSSLKIAQHWLRQSICSCSFTNSILGLLEISAGRHLVKVEASREWVSCNIQEICFFYSPLIINESAKVPWHYCWLLCIAYSTASSSIGRGDEDCSGNIPHQHATHNSSNTHAHPFSHINKTFGK